MMYNLINGNMGEFYRNFNGLAQSSLGIAVGIILASVCVQVVLKTLKRVKLIKA